MIFKYATVVRMYDTDAAQILFFGSIYRLFNDAFEEMMIAGGIGYERFFGNDPYAFVIVHSEADYLVPMTVGDKLMIHTHVSHIGTTSFEVTYQVFRSEHLVSRGKSVHVMIDKGAREKTVIPEKMKGFLEKYRI